ncbi:unnamed protein product [Calypogeia fissa]
MGTVDLDKIGPAIGIDLGTTYSCVGVWYNNWVEIVANEEGNRKTSSWVAFRDAEFLVGDAALNQAAMNSSNTVFDIRRLIGRRFSDASVQRDRKLWPFWVSPGPRDQPLITVQYQGEQRQFAAEQVCSMLMARMKQVAEAFLRCRVTDCVITVPGNFHISQRQATVHAAEIAGLSNIRIVNEPTAAALAYALHRESVMDGDEKLIMIYDLGGGTLSVSVVYVQECYFEVKATAGDSHLGGRDFDRRMVDHFVKEFMWKYEKNISGNTRALRKLELACERAKRNLSIATKATIEIDGLFEGIDFYSSITRAQFEQLNMDLFEKCMEPVGQCLQDVNKSRNLIHDVVLVGGSTRIPKLQQLLREYFHGKKLCTNVNPDEAVAFGAAVYAAIFDPSNTSEKLQIILPVDVTPMSIGVEAAGGLMSVVIPRNSVLPAANKMEFWTYPNQRTSVVLRIYEGESTRARDNNLLAVYELSGLPPAPEDGLHIAVDIEVDVNGLLVVTAEGKNREKYQCTRRNPSTPLHRKAS